MSVFVTLNVLNFAEVLFVILIHLRICCQIQNQKAPIFYFMHMDVLPVVCLYHVYVNRGLKKVLYPLELELCMTISCHIGDVN